MNPTLNPCYLNSLGNPNALVPQPFTQYPVLNNMEESKTPALNADAKSLRDVLNDPSKIQSLSADFLKVVLQAASQTMAQTEISTSTSSTSTRDQWLAAPLSTKDGEHADLIKRIGELCDQLNHRWGDLNNIEKLLNLLQEAWNKFCDKKCNDLKVDVSAMTSDTQKISGLVYQGNAITAKKQLEKIYSSYNNRNTADNVNDLITIHALLKSTCEILEHQLDFFRNRVLKWDTTTQLVSKRRDIYFSKATLFHRYKITLQPNTLIWDKMPPDLMVKYQGSKPLIEKDEILKWKYHGEELRQLLYRLHNSYSNLSYAFNDCYQNLKSLVIAWDNFCLANNKERAQFRISAPKPVSETSSSKETIPQTSNTNSSKKQKIYGAQAHPAVSNMFPPPKPPVPVFFASSATSSISSTITTPKPP